MNKKITVVVGAIALALSANAIVVPAPSCAGAAVSQMHARAADCRKIPDKGDNNTVLWYLACIVGMIGVGLAIEWVCTDWS